jgi:NADP-dependent 3-hydroxy acid dehydrogenase YdfG
MDLTDRVAVVTGASSGIGAAVGRRLAAAGARVALLARREDRLAEVAADCGGLAVAADVTDPGSLAAAAARVHEELGPVDLVVANAGVLAVDPLLDEDPARLAALVTTNVAGSAWTGRLFLADLAGAAARGARADVVFVGSPAAGAAKYPLMAHYGATKAAIHQLAGSMRAELALAGVRVHVIEPSWTVTELTAGYAEGVAELATRAPEKLAQLTPPDPSIVPLTPEDVAGAVAWMVAAPPEVNLFHVGVAPTRLGV